MSATRIAAIRNAEANQSHATTNVGTTERMLSAVAGGALVIAGTAHRSAGGLLSILAGAGLMYRAATGHCALYDRLGVNTARASSPVLGVSAGHGFKYETSITIQRPAADLYRFWRDLKNLPRVMGHLDAVVEKDHLRSHWVARGPLGKTVEWDAEVHNERENEMIAWRSVPGSQMDTAGSVHFQSTPDRGTILKLSLKYDPPGGKAGAALAWLLGSGLEKSVDEDLRHFKQWMEAGELASTEGQPRGNA